MNVITVGLSEQQQFLFDMLEIGNNQVRSYSNCHLAIEQIKRNEEKIDWIVVRSFDENSGNKELLCMARSMGVSPEILVINDHFTINVTRPSLCSVEQTDDGPKLLKCAMHNMLAESRSNAVKQNRKSVMVFEYQGKRALKH